MKKRELNDRERRAVAYRLADDTRLDAYTKAGYGPNSSEASRTRDAKRFFNRPHIAKVLATSEKAIAIEHDLLNCEKKAHSMKLRIIDELSGIAFDSGILPDRGRLKSLELLGKVFGLFIEKVEHSAVGGFTFTIVKPEQPKEAE